MDDANLLVKELRIDWETLQTDDINPLNQSLENKKSNYKRSNYRNTYHKVQKVIDKIIEIRYKGFSDSVISHMESYNYTVKCLENIDNINTTLDILTNITVNDKELSENYESTAYLRRENEICGILANIVGLYEKYLEHVTNKMYIEACSFARDIFDSIESNEFDIITGVKYFLNDELSESVRKVTEEIFRLLGLYICHDVIENKKYFRYVEILNKLEDFDKYLCDVIN
ncbi:uncharacterized protein LOC117224868 [Megalopta genalis]|uniref:uncharacterized protein LOC117224868 n=1 Tax=Megalopta genalis TaxID=115081 RepID=UPI003FD2E3A7